MFLRAAFRGILRTLRILPPRPFGITLLAIGFLVGGLITAVLGLMEFARAGGNDSRVLGAALQTLAGAIYLIAAFGLWDMRRWAWPLSLGIALFNIALSLGNPLWLIVWAAVTIYLVLVRESFDSLWKRAKRALAGS